MKRLHFILLVALILIQAGCATFDKKDDTASRSGIPGETVASLIGKLETVNQTLVTCKGIGRMNFVRSGRGQHLRIAWVSRVPEKLRVAILGPDGRPLLTVSADGTWLYALDKSAPDGHRLQTVLGLPLDVRSLALILAGRIPEFDYDRTEASAGRTADETAVVLKKWWNRVGKVYVGKTRPAILRPTILRIESYRQTGEVRYIADIMEIQIVKGYVVPRILTINPDAATRFTLDIDRYWVNEPVSPEMFVLQPPE